MPEERNEIRCEGTSIQLCWQLKQIGKFVSPGPTAHWKPALRNLKVSMLADKQSAAYVELDKFAERYLAPK
jgi:hypothetical protein